MPGVCLNAVVYTWRACTSCSRGPRVWGRVVSEHVVLMLHGKDLTRGWQRVDGLRRGEPPILQRLWRETFKAGGPSCMFPQREAQRCEPGVGGHPGAWGWGETWLTGLHGRTLRASPEESRGKECVWALWARSCSRPFAWQNRSLIETGTTFSGWVCSGCRNEKHRFQWLEIYFLTVREAKSRCPQGGLLRRIISLACRWPSFPCVFTWSPKYLPVPNSPVL